MIPVAASAQQSAPHSDHSLPIPPARRAPPPPARHDDNFVPPSSPRRQPPPSAFRPIVPIENYTERPLTPIPHRPGLPIPSREMANFAAPAPHIPDVPHAPDAPADQPRPGPIVPEGYFQRIRTPEHIETASDFFISHRMTQFVIETATFDGKIGEWHSNIEKMKNRFLRNGRNSDDGESVYQLSGDTRAELFLNTLSTFRKAGADAGAFIGHYLLAPYDALFGTGVLPKRDEAPNFMNKGVFGYMFEGVITGIGWTSELVGAGVGLAVGALSLPKKEDSTQTTLEWIKGKALDAKEVSGKAVTMALGNMAGALLDVFRFGSLTLKYFFSTVMALGSLFAGIFGGAARALIGQ